MIMRYFNLFSNCIPVKGFSQSVICDLQMQRYEYIPNMLFEILLLAKYSSINELKELYKGEQNEGIDNYFNYLTEMQFDYKRSIKGGLNSAFMSIYIPSRMENNGAKAHADSLIDIVEKLGKDFPDKLKVITGPEEAEKYLGTEIVTLPMGMENGSPLEGDLKNLQHFYGRGIRYVTLCHVKDNHICDSSGDDTE
ncbi:MAG TPA: membrane dipeptidase, partial [Bacteroidia bacterium]|nr:membrane dipeptidase [Bacteroidia bacterium]